VIRAPSPDRMRSGSRRHSGGEAVIDEDGGTAPEVRARAIAPIQAELSVDLTTLRCGKSSDVVVSQPERFHEPLIKDQHIVRSDRPYPKLFMTWCPELADDDDVERRVQRDGDLVRDHDAPAWQPEDVRVLVIPRADALGEDAAGLGPIGEEERFVERRQSSRVPYLLRRAPWSPARRKSRRARHAASSSVNLLHGGLDLIQLVGCQFPSL